MLVSKYALRAFEYILAGDVRLNISVSIVHQADLVDAVIGNDAVTGPVNGYAVRMGRNTAMNPVLEASSLANYTWTRTVSSQMGSAYGELNFRTY